MGTAVTGTGGSCADTIFQARGLRNANFPTKMRITYFAEKSLKVELMYKKEDEWTDCFEVNGVVMPSVPYLGFSAHTGELSDSHDIIKVETKNLYNAGGAKAQMDASRNKYSTAKGKPLKPPHSGGGWSWFLLKVILFGLVVAAAYVGFTIYRTRQRDRF